MAKAPEDHPEPESHAPAGARRGSDSLPADLEAGLESLAGMAMDGVRVHSESGRPADLDARAVAQGSDIRLAPGQAPHSPREAWHVVQQRPARAEPAPQAEGVPINGDPALEREADRLGARAAAGGKEASDA